MSERFKFLAGSTASSREEHAQRTKYKNLVMFDGMLDTWYENTFYGRINKNYEPVILVPGADASILKNFPTVADEVKAVGFVTEAFQNFRRDYLQRVASTNITFPVFLEGLVPTTGHMDFENYYSEYLAFLVEGYVTRFSDNPLITDFRSFITVITNTLLSDLKPWPITKSGFLLSKHNPLATTGLVLELANLDPKVDKEKGEIIQDSNFSCYLDYAIAAGFYIDKNAPWRLLINLEKRVTRLLMRAERLQPASTSTASGNSEESLFFGKHSDKSAEDILDSIYRIKTHKDDLFHLQDFLSEVYNKIMKKVAILRIIDYNNNETITRRSEISTLTEGEWTRLLLKTRLHELDRFEQASYETHVREVTDTTSIYGLSYALSKIGDICSKIIKEICETQKQFAANAATNRKKERREDGQNNTNTRDRA